MNDEIIFVIVFAMALTQKDAVVLDSTFLSNEELNDKNTNGQNLKKISQKRVMKERKRLFGKDIVREEDRI